MLNLHLKFVIQMIKLDSHGSKSRQNITNSKVNLKHEKKKFIARFTGCKVEINES